MQTRPTMRPTLIKKSPYVRSISRRSTVFMSHFVLGYLLYIQAGETSETTYVIVHDLK